MKKITTLLVLCALTLAAYAVPARRGWQTRTQADGTTIEIQQIGDEFYHYWETRDGKIAIQQEDGTFVLSDKKKPTNEQFAQKRKASKRYVNRAKKIGAASMPARALFILVSFSDLTFKDASTTYYKTKLGDTSEGAMSMYNYLKEQSNGKYTPPVDVFGPVVLSKKYSYYGQNDSDGNDQHAAEMVVEACKALDAEIDFSQYDNNQDGVVDNVYVLFAGKGEADGGAATTIWPHQWDIAGENLTCTLDGKDISSYACSAELNGRGKPAMGTPLHEFGHVIGLPDYYDTEYESTNYTESRTPGDWSIMDQGSYNNDGNTPPNYSIYDKYYLGWATPQVLAKDEQLNVTLTTAYGDGYQINGGTSLLAATNTKTMYYIENRQKKGWDAYLPGHGMIVWMVKYNASDWENNVLNNTGGSPRYTLISASGDPTEIGKASDPFPGTGSVKSYTPFTGCALTEITEADGNITFKYNGGVQTVVDPFDLTFMANGVEFTKTTSTGKIVLPATEPAACDGMVFVGWTATANYSSATTAPAFVNAGQTVSEPTTFYAVFAEQDGEGSTEISDELTLATTGVSGTSYTDWSGKKATSSAVYAGNSAGGNDAIQLRSKNSTSGIVTTASGGKLAKVQVVWNSNTSDRTLDIYGKTTAYSAASDLYDNSGKGTKLGSMASGTDTELTISGDYTFVGVRSNNGALWIDKITFVWSGKGASYKNYTTSCDGATPIDNVDAKPAAVKAIRNGRIVIIRDGAVFDLTGTRIE